MEWVLLLLLVPAIVVPVVLLFGFAGCSYNPRVAPETPTIVSATPLGADLLKLVWMDENADPVTFEVERQKGAESPLQFGEPAQPFVVEPNTFLDDPATAATLGIPALQGGTLYSYRVRAIRQDDGVPSGWSEQATVLTFARVFSSDLEQAGVNVSKPGACIVQRLSMSPGTLIPGALILGGNLVRIVLRGTSDAALTLSAVTISEPAPPGQGQDFDSKVTPKLIDKPFSVTAGSLGSLATVEFNVAINKELLIAFDVDKSEGNARMVAGPEVPHTAYIGEPPLGSDFSITQAETTDRGPGFVERPNELWLIKAIEVATKWPPIN